MSPVSRVSSIVAAVVLLIPVCGSALNSTPSSAAAIGADVIVTAAPEYEPLAALQGGERFSKGAQLLLIHEGKPEPLVKNFAASADASVSFDGKRILFAGKQAASDPWQIWEMTLADRSLRRLIAGASDAIRPFYLPAGRLVYAQRTSQGYQLEAAGKDASNAFAPIDADAGSTLLSLSYLSASAIPSDVLADGRVLFEASYPLGSGSTPEMFLVYSDGSGVESYRCDHGKARWGGRQLASGDVVFTHGATLARFTSPLAHETQVAAPAGEYAGAVAETPTGSWLVSAKTAASDHFALKQWKPGAAAIRTVLVESGENLVDPVLVAPRYRPKRHPSGLHDWNYANLLALDARQSREGDLKTAPASVRMETMEAGHAVIAGTAPVETDGSFFVKVPADKPIRFSLLDDKGAVLRAEHGWFWTRKGEQRICVGCHAGPERASENRVPAVLLRTTTPVDLTGAAQANAAKPKTPGSPQTGLRLWGGSPGGN